MEAKFLQQKIMRDFLGDPRIAELFIGGRSEGISAILISYQLTKTQEDANWQKGRLYWSLNDNSPEGIDSFISKFEEWVQAQSSPE